MIDTQNLKEKVLDLAMRGKLVDQDSEDGNARDLLKAIALEREQLVAEKKVKKTEALPPIETNEIPYEIPESWEWVRLGYIITLISGKDFKRSEYNDREPDGIPYLTGASNLSNEKLIIDRWTKKPENIAIKNDILISVKGTVGKLHILSESRVHIARQFMSIRLFSNKINLKYLYYYLVNSIGSLSDSAKGLIPGISRIDLLDRVIPLPPAKEQKRIADKIEEIFRHIDNLEEQQNKFIHYQELLQEKALELAMQGMLVPQVPEEGTARDLLEKVRTERQQLIDVGKIKKTQPLPEITADEIPYEIPESWEWVRLGDIGHIVTGNTPSKKIEKYYRGKIPFIKPGNINNDCIHYQTEDYLTEEGSKMARIAEKNDILITCIGNLGRSSIVSKVVAFNQQINMIKVFGEMSSDYLKYAISGQYFLEALELVASATTIKIVNKSKLSNLLIPLPPLKEQERIVNKLEEINRIIYTEQES